MLESFENKIKAENAVGEFNAAELNTDEGMEILIAKLDSIYYTSSKFINFSRKENGDMNEYIIEFEHLHKKMRDYEVKLPDPVLAFKSLDGASISDDNWNLALALGKDRKFEGMKSALKR